MIKINLCPIDELENQYWYVADVAAILVIAVAAYFGVWWHLEQIKNELEVVMSRTSSLEQSRLALEPDLKRFETLDADIAKLNARLESLKDITVSKISKYRPVIVMEHLQNLKPEGLWYSHMKIGSGGDGGFELRGQAFDNVLVAELIMALRSTASTEADESDLRTAVYFDQLELIGSSIQDASPKGFPELKAYPSFDLKGRFVERGKGPGRAGGEKAPWASGTSPRDEVERMGMRNPARGRLVLRSGSAELPVKL